MASKDVKKEASSSSSSSRNRGGIRTLSDLNRASSSDSDSDPHPQEYYTGGHKSGMLVQDPTKRNDVDSIFNQARELGALQAPFIPPSPSPSPSTTTSFSGTGRFLSGEPEVVPPAPPQQQHHQQQQQQQPPQVVVHNIVFWTNGFTVNDGPLRSLDDPEQASFLESIKKSECPKELEPADRRTPVNVNLIRRDEKYQEPEKAHVPFQGQGRTLGSSDIPPVSVASAPSTSLNAAPSPTMGLAVVRDLPSTSIQLRLADGTRMIAHFNFHHTVRDIRSFIDASRPGGSRNYNLQTVGFPPKILTDPNQTIEQADLANSVIIQKL